MLRLRGKMPEQAQAKKPRSFCPRTRVKQIHTVCARLLVVFPLGQRGPLKYLMKRKVIPGISVDIRLQSAVCLNVARRQEIVDQCEAMSNIKVRHSLYVLTRNPA